MKSQRRLSEVSVVLCLVTMSSQVLANPVDESLRAGRARFDRSAPGSLAIHQDSDRLIINWRDFSIAAGETTRFIQPSATSIALNRVVTANPSRLFGNLEANGKVYLINPNGILVGRGGTVNTRGFVASTLNVSDASFLSSSKLKLSGDSEASVVNEGSIQAIGGDVFLVGRTVENSGAIRAGTVGLGAGNEVMIVPMGRERLSVIAGNPNGGQAGKGVNNEGTIEAVSSELKAAGGNIYALAINNGGIIRATGVRREGGRVFLSSGGGDIENSGTIVANNANGSGGFVSLAGGHNDASPSTVINSGTIEARGDIAGTKGGEVRLTGDHVGLFGSGLIDVSGHSGGGVALVGGGYQGSLSSIQNADRTFIGQDAAIKADATVNGNGGRVIVWANGVTRFYGTISARGGAQGGDGGFVEVSGKDSLEYRGSANLRSAFGHTGSLLLDPKFIIISSAGTDPVGANDEFTENATGTSTIAPADLVAALNTADVILRANTDITISDAVDASGNANTHDLTLRAGRSIFDDANITVRGAFLATVNDASADSANRDPGAAVFTMGVGATITAPDGITIQSGALAADSSGPTSVAANSGTLSIENLSTAGTGAASSGNIVIDGNADVTIAGTIATGDATATDVGGDQTAQSGNITITAGGTVMIQPAAVLSTGTASLVGTDSGNDVDKAISGDIDITAGTLGGITIDGNLTTGNATIASDEGSGNDERATTGNITVSAGTSVSGGGRLVTGNASLDGDSANGMDIVTSGSISVTAGTGGVNGGISLGIADALTTGNAIRNDGPGVGDASTTDNAATGDITLISRDAIGSLLIPVNVLHGTGTAGTVDNGLVSANTAAGGADVFLGSSSLLRIGAINVGVGDLTLTADEIDLDGGADSVEGTGGIVLRPSTAGGTIAIAGAGGTAALDLTASDLNALKDGFSGITIGRSSDGTGTLTVSGASAFNDNLTLVGGSLVLNDTVTSAGNTVTLTARTGNITDGNGLLANVVAASLSASAQTGIDLDTTITTLTLANVLGTGEIDISDTAGGLAVTTATTANGDITLNATGGDLSVTTVTANGAGADVQLSTTISGDVIVGAVTAAGDIVTINSFGAIIDGNAGTVNIVADSLSATAGAGIDLDTDIATLTLATAGGAGNIDINDTVGDLAVGIVTALASDVTLTSVGAITDANGPLANVVAGTLTVTAQTGIDLDTTITTLTLADVLAAGTINIADTDGLAVTTATTFDGNITLGATGGTLDVTTVTAGGAGDVQLTTTTSGNVNVGAVTAAGDTVTITSAGAITDGNAGAVNIVADNLSATAQSGIDLDTTLTTLTLASVLGAGNLNIADTDGLIVTAATAANGNIDISAAGMLTVASATTTSGGNITLSATGGDLDVTTANAGGNGDIQLTTTTSGNVNVGTVTATGDDVTITSAGTITDGNAGAVNVTADSLTATATSFGTSGDPIETSVNSLDVNTSTAGGDQFITEANGLTALSLNAGAGDVNLTLTLGGVADTDGATDITADQATVLLSDATAQGFGTLANTIQTSVNDLSVSTAAGNGSQFITEANGLTALNLNAGAGSVTLTAGAITDTDPNADITAGSATVTAASFGGLANAINTAVNNLSVDTSVGGGSQFITEANGLTALNLNAGAGDVNLTVSLGSLADTDGATDIAAANVSVGTIGTGGSIGAAANPIRIDASGASVLLTALGGGGGVHVEVAQAGTVSVSDSQTLGTTGFRSQFTHGATTFDTRYGNDLTIKANGSIVSTMAAGTSLLVPGTLTLNAVGAGSSIGGGIVNPFAIDAGTLNASAGAGLAFSEAGNLILGNISTVSGAFFIEAANTFTFNNSTVINAGVGGTALLVANGIPGVSVVGTPSINSRFLLYALNAELTDPLVIINSLGNPSIGALVADAIDSPRTFNPLTPDPFGDLLNHFVFSLEANPPTDPSLFIDIPVEVFQPVSIVFGDYDPTKFGEVGDLWMSSSELYEIERKARKAPKALPVQVNRSKYVPETN